MPENLPYLSTPGSIKNALDKIRVAATPDRVTVDFITTKLDIKGGTGRALLPFLKKIGFVNSDGTPTEVYRHFRNPTTGGAAMAKTIQNSYKPLQSVNEYFYKLKDSDLAAAIVQVTGAEAESAVVKLTLATLKNLKTYAKFEEVNETTGTVPMPSAPPISQQNGASTPATTDSEVRLNLAYTINLNLPATSDQAVFNAIFRSLKENLLSYAKE